MSILRITLSAPNVPDVVFNNNRAAQGLHTTKEAIKGLWSAPSLKTSLTERQTGDGAFTPGQVLYSARTVTIPFVIVDYSHENLQAYRDSIGRLMGSKSVRMSVVDGDNIPFYVTGHIQPEYSDVFHENGDTGSINVVCEDPCRYSVNAHESIVNCTGEHGGGLNYGDGKGLVYPIDYGASVNNSMTVLNNEGSYKSYPKFILNGYLNSGARISWSSSGGAEGEIVVNSDVSTVPMVLDSKTRSSNTGGLDTTFQLGNSSWPSIEPKGTLTVRLLASGDGWLSASSHDVWM
jgi:hypothetical protein